MSAALPGGMGPAAGAAGGEGGRVQQRQQQLQQQQQQAPHTQASSADLLQNLLDYGSSAAAPNLHRMLTGSAAGDSSLENAPFQLAGSSSSQWPAALPTTQLQQLERLLQPVSSPSKRQLLVDSLQQQQLQLQLQERGGGLGLPERTHVQLGLGPQEQQGGMQHALMNPGVQQQQQLQDVMLLSSMSPRSLQLVTAGVGPAPAGAAGSNAVRTSAVNHVLRGNGQAEEPQGLPNGWGANLLDSQALRQQQQQQRSGGVQLGQAAAASQSGPNSSAAAQAAITMDMLLSMAPGLALNSSLTGLPQLGLGGTAGSPAAHLSNLSEALGTTQASQGALTSSPALMAQPQGPQAATSRGGKPAGSGLASDSETSHMSGLPGRWNGTGGGAQQPGNKDARATRAAQRAAAKMSATQTPTPAPALAPAPAPASTVSRGSWAGQASAGGGGRARGGTGVEQPVWGVDAGSLDATSSGLPLPGAASPPEEQGGARAPDEQPRSCHCKKSQCLKLYCDCFAAGVWCWSCACTDCHNKPKHAALVAERREQIIARDPKAFTRKIQLDGGGSAEKHKKGCNCKRSKCLKKYCECYQGGVRCSGICKCVDCENQEGSLSPLPNLPRAPAPTGRRGPVLARAASTTNTNTVLAEAAAASAAAASVLNSLTAGPMAVDDVPVAKAALQVPPHQPGPAPRRSNDQAASPASPVRESDPELLLQAHAQAAWPSSLGAGAGDAPSLELRQVLDGGGLNTPPSLLRPGGGLTKPGSVHGFGGLDGDEQQLLVMQLHATPSTLRYPHSLMGGVGQGPGPMEEEGARGGTGPTTSQGHPQHPPPFNGSMLHGAAAEAAATGAAAAAAAAAAAGPARDPLASALQLLRSTGPSPAPISAEQQAGSHSRGDAASSQAAAMTGGFGSLSSVTGVGEDRGEALLHAPPEELGDEEACGDLELGSASWRLTLSRLAGTPGGVARLLASPCRSSLSLSSPLPPPDLLLPRSGLALGGSGGGMLAGMPWASDLLMSPNSTSTLLGGSPMAGPSASDPLAGLGGSLGGVPKQHQGVVGSVEALVSPVRTSRRASTSGVKRNLGLMMGDTDALLAPSGMAMSVPVPVPHSPGLDALALAAAAETQAAVAAAGAAQRGSSLPPGFGMVVTHQGRGQGLGGEASGHVVAAGPGSHGGPSSSAGNAAASGSVSAGGHPGLVVTTSAGDGPAGSLSPRHKRSAVGAGAVPSRPPSVGLREQPSVGNHPQLGLPGLPPLGAGPGSAGGGGPELRRLASSSLSMSLRSASPLPAAPGSAEVRPLAAAGGSGSLPVPGLSLEALKAQASDYINSRCRPVQQLPGPGVAAARSNSLPVPPPSQHIPTPARPAGSGGPVPVQQQPGAGLLGSLGGPLPSSRLANSSLAVPPPRPAVASAVQAELGGASPGPMSGLMSGGIGREATPGLEGGMGMGGGMLSSAPSLPTGSSSALPMLCGTPWGDTGLDGGTLDSLLMSPGGSGGFPMWESLLSSPRMMTPLYTKGNGQSSSLFCSSPPASTTKWWGAMGGGASAVPHPTQITTGAPPPTNPPQGLLAQGLRQQQQQQVPSVTTTAPQLLRMTPGTTLVSPSSSQHMMLGSPGLQQLQPAPRGNTAAAGLVGPAGGQRLASLQVQHPQQLQPQQQQQQQQGHPGSIGQVPA